MKCVLLTVGKPKAQFAALGLARYVKRLRAYGGCDLLHLRPAKGGGRAPAEIKAEEGGRILGALKHGDLVWALDVKGQGWSSEQWAKKLQAAQRSGRTRLVLVIGGAEGLSSEVLKRADHTVSLGPATLAHQLAAVVVLEQLYRAGTILAGTPYHRA